MISPTDTVNIERPTSYSLSLPSFSTIKQNRIVSLFLVIIGASVIYGLIYFATRKPRNKTEAEKSIEIANKSLGNTDEKWFVKIPRVVEQGEPSTENCRSYVVDKMRKLFIHHNKLEDVSFEKIYIVGTPHEYYWEWDPSISLKEGYPDSVVDEDSLVLIVELKAETPRNFQMIKEKYPKCVVAIVSFQQWEEIQKDNKWPEIFEIIIKISVGKSNENISTNH
jgi:hypothetical protein